MRKFLRPLIGARAFKGWVFSLAGGVVGALPMPVALILVLALRIPKPVAPAALLVASAVLVTVLGFPHLIREGCVRLTNQLLGTRLPAPVRGSRWPNRLRTGVWLLLHSVAGCVLTVLAFTLVIAAFVPMYVWAAGGGQVAYFFVEVKVAGGIGGLWTVAAAAFYLVVFVCLGAGVTTLLRTIAPVFLGPRTAERVAALEEHANLLAHRNRLAQELHDSIGHTLTASTIQAAVASRLMDSEPETARRALHSIEESSRTALEDLDHVLGLLREGRAAKAPQRTLADLPALLDHVRQTGTRVDASLGDTLERVPATISREAYRIVQEGLTNAMRHAGQAPVQVRVATHRDWLDVELTNPLAGVSLSADPERRGHGLVGIVDRVRLLRGEVTFSPVVSADGEHWRLAARLPLRAGA